MDLTGHYQMLARYNRIANERLYEACAKLSDEEYRQHRQASFGSIHSLLNHILLGDRIWIDRFEGGGLTTPALNTILYDQFGELRAARVEQDAKIEQFFGRADAGIFGKSFTYINSRGQQYTDQTFLAAAHLFNHQSHHRGQVHVLLSQTSVPPPSLDMHRIIKP
jgi:uncharacterized damage-inducible protein DinB